MTDVENADEVGVLGECAEEMGIMRRSCEAFISRYRMQLGWTVCTYSLFVKVEGARGLFARWVISFQNRVLAHASVSESPQKTKRKRKP